MYQQRTIIKVTFDLRTDITAISQVANTRERVDLIYTSTTILAGVARAFVNICREWNKISHVHLRFFEGKLEIVVSNHKLMMA